VFDALVDDLQSLIHESSPASDSSWKNSSITLVDARKIFVRWNGITNLSISEYDEKLLSDNTYNMSILLRFYVEVVNASNLELPGIGSGSAVQNMIENSKSNGLWYDHVRNHDLNCVSTVDSEMNSCNTTFLQSESNRVSAAAYTVPIVLILLGCIAGAIYYVYLKRKRNRSRDINDMLPGYHGSAPSVRYNSEFLEQGVDYRNDQLLNIETTLSESVTVRHSNELKFEVPLEKNEDEYDNVKETEYSDVHGKSDSYADIIETTLNQHGKDTQQIQQNIKEKEEEIKKLQEKLQVFRSAKNETYEPVYPS
jgi:hypothetical protein